MTSLDPFPTTTSSFDLVGKPERTAERHPFTWGFFVALGVSAAGVLLSALALIGFAILAGISGKL